MSKYRNALPQLGSRLFLTDGGLETTLIFLHGIDLPYFASCELLRSQAGRDVLAEYFAPNTVDPIATHGESLGRPQKPLKGFNGNLG